MPRFARLSSARRSQPWFRDSGRCLDLRFDAIDQRFGAVGQRFERLEERIDLRFGAIEERIDLRSEALEHKLTAAFRCELQTALTAQGRQLAITLAGTAGALSALAFAVARLT